MALMIAPSQTSAQSLDISILNLQREAKDMRFLSNSESQYSETALAFVRTLL
jgi:hypothetical protein